MTTKSRPPEGSYEAAELFQLRMALKSTYAQRLQDLQDMLDFNTEAAAKNPRLRRAARQLADDNTQAHSPESVSSPAEQKP
jgi:LPS O-antigen subunit length determinant protein (WzzB/FepE family)